MSDGTSTIAIPDDLAACQALLREQGRLVREQSCLVESLAQSVAELQQKTQRLEEREQEYQLTIRELLQRAFARRSERYLADPRQLQLDFPGTDGATEAAAGLAEAVQESGRPVAEHVRRPRPRKTRSERLPEHLPRHEVIVEPPAELRHCAAHGPRKMIGYDVVETLVMKRPELYVQVTKYPKLACEGAPQCGVAAPERPTGLVEGDRYDASVAAEILTNKYGYHLPIYRQQDMFAGSGWTPSRSTLLNIAVAAHFALRPLVEQIQRAVLADDLLGTDDTTLTLLIPQMLPAVAAGDARSQRTHEHLAAALAKGQPSVRARMWAYRSVNVPLVFFDFTVSRQRAGPDLVLENFRGKLMADCYAGYQGIDVRTDGRIERGACAAHARRKVFEAREAYPLEAALVLAKFQELYDVETRGREMSADQRRALRQVEAKPVWDALGAWLASPAAQNVLPSGKFGEALGYLRNHWASLQLYLSDGRMPIDNNDVEQLMKQIALGRKNWIFTGSVAAGERTADFFTLVASAVRNDLDVWAYLKDVLDRLLAGETDYETLRPDVWRTAHPEAIRQYRAQERRDKADRKQFRRAQRRLTTATSTA
jgi:transposase